MKFLLGLMLISTPALAGHRPLVLGATPSVVAAPDSNVSYFGGPVISHAKVYAVYWGAGVSQEDQTKLETFYKALVNSSYMDVLGEYNTKLRSVDGREGTNQEIGRGTFGAAFTITPFNTSRSLTQASVEQELEAQIAAGKLPRPDADSYYALHYPSGYSISISFGQSCGTWLADHEVYQSKKFGPVYYAMFPCDSDFNTLTFAASHELEEAISDPQSPLEGQPNVFPTGWIRGDGQEIGDLCTGYSGTLHAGGVDYSVNPPWLNSESGCHGGDFK